jgi:salicylate hydroxylase
MLTFPVKHGQTLNIVAFRTTSDDWPDFQKLTRTASREDVLRDHEGYGPNVIKLLELTNPELDVVSTVFALVLGRKRLTSSKWAIFDLGDHPVSTFAKGRICISGDAAHATSPHHGAGAGFCIEDSAVMAELLADQEVRTQHDLDTVFATFDAQRRPRGQWLAQSSRWIGDCYEWQAMGVGKDFKKIEAEINERNGIIANVDIRKMCEQAREDLRTRLTEAARV